MCIRAPLGLEREGDNVFLQARHPVRGTPSITPVVRDTRRNRAVTHVYGAACTTPSLKRSPVPSKWNVESDQYHFLKTQHYRSSSQMHPKKKD